MRREDQRMPPDECEALLRRAEIMRVAMVDAQGPYVVPVNYGYHEGRIYIHGTLSGRRFAAVGDGARVCFEVDEGEVLRGANACSFTSRFSSVIGYGTARMVATDEEKRLGLDAIMRHYGSTGEGIPDSKLKMTSVMEIVVESYDGKWNK